MTGSGWGPMDERGPRVSDEAVRRFERRIGATLPDDYRAFLLEINGGRTATSHCAFKLRRGISVLNSLFSLDDPEERNDLATRQQYTHDLPSNGLLIGYADGGNIILIIADPHVGEVWHLVPHDRPEGSNPRVEWFDRRDVTKLAGSFREFMDGLTPLEG